MKRNFFEELEAPLNSSKGQSPTGCRFLPCPPCSGPQGGHPSLLLTPMRTAELQHMAEHDQKQPWLLSRLLRQKTMVPPAAH